MRALDDLVREGLVRYVGCSNWQAWKIAKAQGIADHRGLARFATVQAYYSLAGRDLERDIVPMMREEGVGPDGLVAAGGRAPLRASSPATRRGRRARAGRSSSSRQ